MGISIDSIQSDFHSIVIKDSGGDELAIDGSGKITAIVEDGGGSLTVDGTVAATQSGTWTIDSITNVVSVDDNGASLTVDATDFDIRQLDHVTEGDSVRVGDGTEILEINADGSINVNTTPGGFGSWKVSAETVTSTESELVSSPLSGRLRVLIQNLGSQDVYIKEATGVSTANGLEVPKKSSFEADLDDGANIFAITGSGSSDVRIAEYAS